MPIIFQPISWRDAETILTWRYPPPLALYNPPSDYLLWLLDPDNRYHTIIDEAGQLIGFFCLGLDAQVPGGDYHAEEALDVGLGLRPDMIGRGLGTELLRAVLDFARQALNPPAFRVTVATFNGRAMRMCEKVGFRPVRTFAGATPQGIYEFVQLLRDAAARTD